MFIFLQAMLPLSTRAAERNTIFGIRLTRWSRRYPEGTNLCPDGRECSYRHARFTTSGCGIVRVEEGELVVYCVTQ